jgi:hypothetical protein
MEALHRCVFVPETAERITFAVTANSLNPVEMAAGHHNVAVHGLIRYRVFEQHHYAQLLCDSPRFLAVQRIRVMAADLASDKSIDAHYQGASEPRAEDASQPHASRAQVNANWVR